MRSGRGSVLLVMAAALLTGAGLVAAGRGPLASPPVRAWDDVNTWYEQVGAGAAALTALRLVAVLAAGWIVVATVLQLVGGTTRRRIVQRVADGVSPRWLTRLAHGAAGLAVTVGLAGPPVPSDPAGTAVMEVLEEPGSATSTTTTPTTTTTTTTSAPPPRTPPAAPDSPPPPIAAEEVVVARGDSFWSLAVEAVAASSRPATVDAYWRRLVELNRPRLVDPANPDLLYPGQVLVLPPIP